MKKKELLDLIVKLEERVRKLEDSTQSKCASKKCTQKETSSFIPLGPNTPFGKTEEPAQVSERCVKCGVVITGNTDYVCYVPTCPTSLFNFKGVLE